MMGPDRDVPGECNSRLQLGDDHGDGDCTFRCTLEDGHDGPHQEEHEPRVTTGARLVTIQWEGDDRANSVWSAFEWGLFVKAGEPADYPWEPRRPDDFPWMNHLDLLK